MQIQQGVRGAEGINRHDNINTGGQITVDMGTGPLTLNMAAWGSPSSWKGGLPVAISMMVQPRDQMSAGAPYPRGPLSMISGAMYCSVPGNTQRTTSKGRYGKITTFLCFGTTVVVPDIPANVRDRRVAHQLPLKTQNSPVQSSPRLCVAIQSPAYRCLLYVLHPVHLTYVVFVQST